MGDTFQLRVYSYLDRMQPQYAAFVGTITQGDLPTEGMAALYIEVAPGNEVFRLVDIAVKATEARPGAQIVEREFGMFEVHSMSQAEVLEDGELLQERVNTTVSSLLGLIGIQADPLQSREHILLANIIHGQWIEGRDLDLVILPAIEGHRNQVPVIVGGEDGVLILQGPALFAAIYFELEAAFAEQAWRAEALAVALLVEGQPLELRTLLLAQLPHIVHTGIGCGVNFDQIDVTAFIYRQAIGGIAFLLV